MASPSPAQPTTDLTIQVTAPKASADAPTRKWTLTCDPAQGTHPDPTAACAALGKAPDPFTPVSKEQVCTMIFGGPEEATVTGTWKGKRVAAKFNRKNGCEVSRWNGLAPVFGKPAQTG
ncbi:SSI family serine proteinase inhibitor [Actinomadura alba]|uniref:SSI family serine proteinase inhibitor n=1 Tax=Actinomadura alba TaxID=406431 RepID=UPI0028AE65A9|nr:SSI family serine proteinase inhibitor [Actinomadura alba]